MGDFSTRQIVLFVIALLVAGALTAWGTTYVLERFVLVDLSDPLTKQGGLSPAQEIGIGKK
jgi:hypothetical protein